ncbi:unnamed protein product [Dibothriocephalus latus]|uniref:Uncharacterized protein n=1 Tax=Dibothriocephalus latus TaxID=60516 RepID=A0A3P7NZS9_DIBLA|nr:unnamed protein product [Dibothriocephalus latus]
MVSTAFTPPYSDLADEDADPVPYEQKRRTPLDNRGAEDAEECRSRGIQSCAYWKQGPPSTMKHTSELSAKDLVCNSIHAY